MEENNYAYTQDQRGYLGEGSTKLAIPPARQPSDRLNSQTSSSYAHSFEPQDTSGVGSAKGDKPFWKNIKAPSSPHLSSFTHPFPSTTQRRGGYSEDSSSETESLFADSFASIESGGSSWISSKDSFTTSVDTQESDPSQADLWVGGKTKTAAWRNSQTRSPEQQIPSRPDSPIQDPYVDYVGGDDQNWVGGDRGEGSSGPSGQFAYKSQTQGTSQC